MPTPEAFAKTLVQQVRDAAIRSCDMRLLPDAKGRIPKRWRAAGKDLDSVAKEIIPDIVDDTIFYLLNAIDNRLLPLAYMESPEKVVDLTDGGFGEMAGCYMDPEGWREKYSSERFVDDFADLKLK